MENNNNFDRILEMNTEAEKRRTIIKTHQDFIDKSFEVHGNRYSYPELYSGNNIKMRIICSIHGEFFQTPKKHIYDKQGCPKCAKNKRYTNAEFINRASQKHNNKYDYSLTEYVNMHTKVKIICPKHGIFQQTPDCHLKGIGCPMCKIEASKKEIYGVATNDLLYCCNSKSYKIWKSMIGRCFNKDIKNRHKSYKECDCCKDWLLFSNFKRWYDAQPHAYEDGYELDKDIFSEDKGFYSPQTCCLIPERLNIILVYRTASPNGLPRGIAKPANRYSVRTPFL